MSLQDEFLKRWKLIVAVVAVLGYLGLDASGLRWTWFFEHQALASDFYSSECKRLKTEWYIAKDQAELYIQKGQPVPRWIREKLSGLEAEMKRFNCGPQAEQ